MVKSAAWLLGTVAVAGAVALGFFFLKPHRRSAPLVTAKTAHKEVRAVSAKPPVELESFVEKNAKSADPKVQDLVGVARARMGYAHATKKEFKAARSQFLTAARDYKGSGVMSSDWGSIPDQAAYQATVCLVADGKTGEAKAEFSRFMKERPYSPLVHAVYKRLVKMDPKRELEYNGLLQDALRKQDERSRFETSVCGPKSIAYLLDQGLIAGPKTTYQALAKTCGTTNDGTSIAGMRKGLQAIGIESHVYKLNRQDLERAHKPMIVLEADHYLVLLRITGDAATFYDSRFREEKTVTLPRDDDPDYFINAILFRPLEGSA